MEDRVTSLLQQDEIIAFFHETYNSFNNLHQNWLIICIVEPLFWLFWWLVFVFFNNVHSTVDGGYHETFNDFFWNLVSDPGNIWVSRIVKLISMLKVLVLISLIVSSLKLVQLIIHLHIHNKVLNFPLWNDNPLFTIRI